VCDGCPERRVALNLRHISAPLPWPGAAPPAGPDWQSDAATQIRWGLGYIKDLYGSPCGAWAHEQADGWY
jgi:hypothetical protein